MKRLLPIAALLVLSLSAARGQTMLQHGRALTVEFCGSCHAVDKTGASPKTEAPPLRRIGETFDLDKFLEHLQRGVVSDHPDMPQVKFSEQDARDVRAYLRSIQPQ